MVFGIGTSRKWRSAGRRRTGRLLGQSLALALVVPLGVAQVAQAAGPTGLGRPDVPPSRVTKVEPFDGPGAKAARQKVARDRKANAAQAAQAGQERRSAWPKKGEATVAVPDGTAGSTGLARPGGLPVTVTRSSGKTSLRDGDVHLSVLDQQAAREAGITGILLTAESEQAGTARFDVDYSKFASAVGGGWAQRLRLVQLPACALTTPQKPECRKQTPLASDNDTTHQTVSADVRLPQTTSGPSAQLMRTASGASASGATVLAVTAASAGSGQSPNGAGDYSATQLSESSSWEAGGNSGSFTWSYGFATPPAAAGPAPSLSLSYDSGSVDGRTASTNNQGTSVGEGFTLTESYIERSYGSCDDDGHADVFDQCWKYDNATLVLNGKSTRLIKDDSTGVWHLADDDASKVVRSTGADNGDDNGEYWTVTTGDGTKYVFGLNKLDGAGTQRTNSTWTVPVFGDDSGEPGYSAGSTFAERSLTQAWRWNLDYVEDTRGNAATYWYTKEANYYKKNKATTADAVYTRGGYPNRIEYGLRKGALFTDNADAKVTFTYDERCTAADCSSLTKDTADDWPDVPFDALCTSGDTDCNAAGPSFFSRKRLTGIHTYSYNATTAAYDSVDSWALTEEYLDGNDIGDSSDQVLALTSITRTGKAGATPITLKPISFTYQMRPNRVDATDDILPLTRPRISTVTSETGAITAVTLSPAECVRSELSGAAEDSNTRSCYPQYWHINGAEEASIDWFHKYRVLAVTVFDPAANNPAVEHAYSYSGAAWHYSDDPFTPKDERTWSDWRGYRQVTALTGATSATRSKTVSLYLQGMNGDKKKDGTTKSATVAPLLDTDVDLPNATDSDRYAGMLRQQVAYNGSQPISSLFKNYTYRQTASQSVPDAADQVARWVRDTTTYTSTYLTASAGWRTRETKAAYDDLGMAVSVDDFGRYGVSGDETCTRTWYARNNSLGITGLVSRTRTVARSCSVADSQLSLPLSATTRGDVLTDTAAVYDTADATTWTAAQTPTKGQATWTGRATGYAATADTNGDRLPLGWQTTATTTYDTLGRLLTVTDTAGHTTSTAYTPAASGPLTKTVTSNPKLYKTYVFLDPRRALPLRSYDINVKKTEQAYDALGRLTDVWLPNRSSSVQGPNLKFDYHLDNAEASWVSTSTVKNDDTYNTSYTLYDALLRPLQTQTPTPQGGRLLTDIRYDTRGLAWDASTDIFDPTKSPNGTYTRTGSGAAPTETQTVYDGAARPTTRTLYVGGVKKWSTTTSYTGDSVAATALDGGSAQRTVTDIRGRTVETRAYESTSPADADYGTGPGAAYASTAFTYGPDGQLKTITGPDGATWSYGYDLFGRQTSASDPDKGTTTSEYNTLDQVIKTTDARGTSILSAYDELGRITGTWSGTETDANQLTAHTYDTVFKGLPSSSTRYVGGTTGDAYTRTVTAYDPLSRPTATELHLPDTDPVVQAGTPTTLAFATYYNNDGTVGTTKEPALGGLPAENIDYDYDGQGNLTEIGGATGYLRNVSYSALSQPEQLTLGTGASGLKNVYVTNTFEEGTGRLISSNVTDQTHPYMLQDLNYTYDQSGNVTKISDPTTLGGTSSADTQCFAYDGHQRLTEAWTPASQDCATARSATGLSGPAPYWTSYAYNTAGQRTSETVHKDTGDTKTTYCYANSAQPHTLTGTSTKDDCTTPDRTYAYDNTGNTTRRPGPVATQSLTWYPEGKLAKLTENGNTTDYLYDASGTLLIRSKQNGERILYAGATELHLRADGSTWAQRYYSAGGIAAAMRSNESGTAKLTYLTADHHGTSTLALTPDTAQTFTKRYTTPFGSDRGAPLYGPWPDDKGFLGKTRDTTTGLTHIGAREYDPGIGQFISIDPILSPDQPESLNGYSYANNNPATASDPTGLESCYPHSCSGDNGTYGTYHPENDPASDKSKGSSHSSKSGTSHAAAGKTAKGGKPVVNKIEIPNYDELSRYASGYADQDTYDFRIQRWAKDICFGSGGNDSKYTGFCDTAKNAGLLEVGKDPFGVQANINCVTGHGDCVEAVVTDLLYLIGAGWNRVAVKGAAAELAAARAVSVETEEAAVARLLKSGCSFSSSTPVLLKNGTEKPISKVKPDDEVATGDPGTGKRKGVRTVIARLVHYDDDLVELYVREKDGRVSRLHTTSRHPFWEENLHGWIPAGNLQPGDTLATAANTQVEVVDVRDEAGSASMYNLTVNDLHTYYVLAGETPVLVHNSNCSLYNGDGWQHVLDEHVNGSPGVAPGNTTFSDYLDLDDIGDLIQDTAKTRGRPNTPDPVTGVPRDGTIHTVDFEYPVGSRGETSVEVILNPDGSLRTAYPR
ncbi:RHS repeat-associated core domain-containing protein [Streptomyces sp. MUM 2J]|uniref:RHS repeat-associated core domain-containing protein n=1 Tax=Streptomyces sp. MUM 2J TaxID=2791987 RepID=UPI001F03DF36|nr:RHS repeat-associated core domain-containing protein [Streptomyces sp. MUM 2J]MCH0566261.1 RHS repeat-associated core domain-containing protein [Streptomyces sp. MUM 2J]